MNNVDKLVVELNKLKKAEDIYSYIEGNFLHNENADAEDELFLTLEDMLCEIEVRYGIISEQESDNIKLKMRDLINEAYENGKLNFIKENSLEKYKE